MSEISEKILAKIEELDLSYSELASMTQIPKSALQRYASGTTEKIPLDRLERIAVALGVPAAYLMGWDDVEPASALTEAGERIGALYDLADDRDQRIVETVLAPYEPRLRPGRKKAPRRVKARADGMEELDVYEQPAAAGLGNYIDAPATRVEQYPAGYIPDGAAFGVLISGDSMEPEICDGSTAFVQPAPAVAAGEIGIFVLNGQAYCKRLIVDTSARRVLLRSVNPAYADIVVHSADELRTIGRVLGSYPR